MAYKLKVQVLAAGFGLMCLVATTRPASAQTYNYGDALQKSIYFYDIQRSGIMPATNRAELRGNSGVTDGADVGKDLTGGFYDAGDHVKFGLPMAFTTTMLSWGAIEEKTALTNSGQLNYLLDNIRWACDYFIKCHTAPNELYGQVGQGQPDHAWWGPAEAMTMARPSYKVTTACPGSDLAGETAAALAAASIAFQGVDNTYSATLLSHAKQLYSFADTYRGKYDSCITDASLYYKSFSGYMDELTWGAAWLYRATGDATYLTKAQTYYPQMPQTCATGQPCMPSYKWGCAWDDKSYPAHVLMAELTGASQYVQDSERWLNWLSVGGTEFGADGTRVTYTPGGLVFVDQWGTTRYATNSAFCAMVFSDWFKTHGGDATHVARYHDWAASQINYVLGSNPRHESYIIGFGTTYPQYPHHRSGHGSWANNNAIPTWTRHILYGAMVGGPDSKDAFSDSRTNYQQTEPADDYNSGLPGLLARMYQEYGGTPIAGFPAKETRDDDELYMTAAIGTSGSTYTEYYTHIVNKTAWPARATNNLSFRVYFTLDGSTAISQITSAVTYTTCSACKVTGPFLKSGSTYYYIVDATGTTIQPGQNPGGTSDPFKEVRFKITSKGTWSQANDFSATGLHSGRNATQVKTTNIPLYAGGTKIFGNEAP